MNLLEFLPVLAWGVFAGGVFSSIGAAGGILTAFGLITLFGVTDPNSVKPMTQLAVLAATVTFIPKYFFRSSLVVPLGLLLGIGGLFGAYAGSTLSSLYLTDMNLFRPLFGVLTLGIAAQIIWQALQANAATGSDYLSRTDDEHVHGTSITFSEVTFSSGNTEFRVPTWSPALAGAAISMTAAIFGVGGGFLLVPYLASLLALPMHIVPATAAISIFMSLIVSISNFVALGASLDYGILAPMGVGIILGSLAGPAINRAVDNTGLKYAMAVIVAVIGVKYTFC